jgi:GrpB-like predicted nucleotidyltransferase (UPF0157 family)
MGGLRFEQLWGTLVTLIPVFLLLAITFGAGFVVGRVTKKHKRTHHLHMVERDSRLWERLFFRDYLREWPDEAERYVALKRSLAADYPNDRVAYTAGKSEYIQSVTDRAKRYYSDNPGEG